jgi:hypothetical protein
MKRPLSLLTLLSLAGVAFAQGPLTPPVGADPAIGPANALTPGGAPQATMKTLHQVEPRIPIDGVPLVINATGSFYLTKNLHFTEPTGDAITIAASDVTIDLNGFAITSDAVVTGSAIVVSGTRDNITVRNGSIRGNSAPPTLAGFLNGIDAMTAQNSRFERLQISSCRQRGITAGATSLIQSCQARGNGGIGLWAMHVMDSLAESNQDGIYGEAAVERCTSQYNVGVGMQSFRVTHGFARLNGDIGIYAFIGTVSHCTSAQNGSFGIYGGSAAVSHSMAYGNGDIGIYVDTGSVANCVAGYGASGGIQADEGSVSHCTAEYNDSHGITANYGTIIGCTAVNNGGIGLNGFGASITQSRARSNSQHGIYATEGVIAQCVASGNNTSATVPFTDIFPSAPDPVSRTGNFPTP